MFLCIQCIRVSWSCKIASSQGRCPSLKSISKTSVSYSGTFCSPTPFLPLSCFKMSSSSHSTFCGEKNPFNHLQFLLQLSHFFKTLHTIHRTAHKIHLLPNETLLSKLNFQSQICLCQMANTAIHMVALLWSVNTH